MGTLGVTGAKTVRFPCVDRKVRYALALPARIAWGGLVSILRSYANTVSEITVLGRCP